MATRHASAVKAHRQTIKRTAHNTGLRSKLRTGLKNIRAAIDAGDTAKAVQQHAAPLEEALRNTIENRPYTAVAVALAIGWFIGRMSRMDGTGRRARLRQS